MSQAAIVAFVSSVLLWFLPVGVSLGLRARLAIRHTGSRGLGFAVAAIAISSAGTCLIIALVTTAILSGDTETGEPARGSVAEAVHITELRRGDCFFASQAATQPGSAPSRIVMRTSCAGLHDAEAYAVLTLPDRPFPGDAALRDEASRQCPAAVGDFTPSSGAATLAAYLRHDRPTEANWQAGDRRVVCYVLDTGIRLNVPQ